MESNSQITSRVSSLITNRSFENGGVYCLSPQSRLSYYQEKLQDVQKSNEIVIPQVQCFKKSVLNNIALKINLEEGIKNIAVGGVFSGSSLDEFFKVLNVVCTEPPKFEDKNIVGLPFAPLFVDLMNNPDGQFFFCHPLVNKHLKNLFEVYGKMLRSPKSLKYMTEEEPHGWLSPKSQKYIDWEDYYYDKTKPHWGFKSWNDFFTKPIRPERRPIDGKHNSIVHSSDSYPLSYPSEEFGTNPSLNVPAERQFLLKDCQYSFYEMFGVKEANVKDIVDKHFVGGTVYQAFLDPWCYHRWHAPVSGTIIKSYKLEGTYYRADPKLINYQIHQGFQNYIDSQPILSMVSVRQVFIIQIDDGSGRCVAVFQIGMAEVSSCKATVEEGEKIKKGSQLGYFQFGGSSMVLAFDKRLDLQWNPTIFEKDNQGKTCLHKVNSWLATFH